MRDRHVHPMQIYTCNDYYVIQSFYACDNGEVKNSS